MKTRQDGEGFEIVSDDERIAALANAVSDAVHAANEAGLDLDYIASVLVNVAADYMRAAYGDKSLFGLAEAVLRRADMQIPDRVQ